MHSPKRNQFTEKEEDVVDPKVPSDRDSTPTSIIRVSPEMWKSGKPLAGEGIVLRPRKPSFTANQMVSNAPSDLIAAIHLDNKGIPRDVEPIISTGSPSIDRALISSLYRWRATGEQIDSIDDDETLEIRIHLTFSTN